ncbi:MAG: hypothetical protein JW749_04325 [Sedimentisphaerales bacterium]|nr:hypothetical protein [Sedimentisphaerales bacterium]
MKHVTLILLALAFCLPAQAEILVFKTTTSGQQFDVGNNLISSKKEGGYLVINADLSNPDNIVVSEAQHLHYEKWAGNPTQNTTLVNDVEILLIDTNKGKQMLLRCFDDTTRRYMVSYGKASLKDIGNIQRYIAGSLKGNDVWKLLDFKTGSANIKLRLDLKATKNANIEGKTVSEIIGEYEELLEQKGYII